MSLSVSARVTEHIECTGEKCLNKKEWAKRNQPSNKIGRNSYATEYMTDLSNCYFLMQANLLLLPPVVS